MLKKISVLLLVWVASVTAFADSEGPFRSYTMETADKKYIFVMLRPGDYPQSAFVQYPQSGLYFNDGSVSPLWTVDWTGYALLPTDGIHLVRQGPWPRQEDGYDVESLTFFANGKLLRTYRVRDLVDFPWLLPQSVSHYRWQQDQPANLVTSKVSFRLLDGTETYEKDQGVIFDTQAATLRLETLNGEKYVFDLRSGEILSADRPMRAAALLGGGIILLFYLPYLWYKSAKPEKTILLSNRKLLFRSILIVTTIGILFVVIITGVDALPESLGRQLSEFKRVETALEAFLLTLLYMPFAIFSLEKKLGQQESKWLLLIWPPVFWVMLLYFTGTLNILLVKFFRLARNRYL